MADFSYIETTGTVLPDTETLLDTVEGEYRAALGAQLNTDPATPQGRLIATEVDARDTYLRNTAALANQINPRIAEGVFLDAILALTGGQRRAMTHTVVSGVVLGGIPGTIIPEGSQAQTPAGDIFQTLGGAVLDATGTTTVDFEAVEGGPVPCVAGELNTAVTAVLGWETVNNPTDGVAGQDVESDTAARNRRLVTLALQGVALPEAIISGLMDTDGVQSLAFRENVGAATAVIDGVSMIGHSIYVCVNGGADSDVAAAILAKKSLGCGYNGSTSVDVVDSASGQTYTVKFDRPTEVPLKCRVTVKVGNTVADPATTIRAAIVAYAAGEIDGEQGFVVGGPVSPFELASAINETTPAIYVRLFEVAKVTDAYGTVEIPITIQQIATINANNIEVITV